MTHMTIGHLYTSLHAGCASAVTRVLEAHDIDVDFLDLDPDDVADALDKGDVDLLVSAWFPRDAGLVKGQARVIGDLYQPRASFSALGPLGPVGSLGVQDVDRIITTEDAKDFLTPALERLPALAMVPIEVVGDAALLARLETARNAAEKPLIVVMQPHAVYHAGFLHPVDDPDGLLGPALSARMILGEGAASCTDSDLIDELSEMMLGNKVMSALDYAITVEGQDPEDAAESWQRGRLIPRDA